MSYPLGHTGRTENRTRPWWSLILAARRERVDGLLSAAGFFCCTTGDPVWTSPEYTIGVLRFCQLSGDQRHFVYDVWQLAPRPKVLIWDEMLGGLNAYLPPRTVQGRDRHCFLFVITTALHQLRIITNCILSKSRGTVTEQGCADGVLEFLKHPDAKNYVWTFRALLGSSAEDGKLAQNYGAIERDQGIAGPWL